MDSRIRKSEVVLSNIATYYDNSACIGAHGFMVVVVDPPAQSEADGYVTCIGTEPRGFPFELF